MATEPSPRGNEELNLCSSVKNRQQQPSCFPRAAVKSTTKCHNIGGLEQIVLQFRRPIKFTGLVHS